MKWHYNQTTQTQQVSVLLEHTYYSKHHATNYLLDEKTKKMEELSLHFSAIVDKKEELIKRLQQPFVGDYISIDADYQR